MLTLTISGKDYKLDVQRRSVKKAEERGVTLSGTGFGSTYDMFYIALVKHHPKMTPDNAYDLLDELIDDPEGTYDPSEVIEILGEQFEAVFKNIENKNPKCRLKKG